MPIQFAREERFEATIDIVRQLSSGTLTRDPQHRIQLRQPTAIRPKPAPQAMNPRVRTFKPLSEWQVRQIGYAARTGKTPAQIRAERAQRDKIRYATDPKFRAQVAARRLKHKQKAQQ
jgi:hypothetical protein